MKVFIVTLALVTLSVAEFIPTNEWQRIPEGEQVPSGLSYKFDFENGGTYAKLSDTKSAEGETTKKQNQVQVVQKTEQELEQEKQLQGRGLAHLNLEVRNQLDDVVDVLKSPGNHSKGELDDAIEWIREEGYSTDIAMAFHQLNGTRLIVESVITKEPLSANADLVEAGLATIGVIGQQNPIIQQQAVSLGILASIKSVLDSSQFSSRCKVRALFALTTLTISNKRAMDVFVRSGGWKTLKQMVVDHPSEKKLMRKLWSFFSIIDLRGDDSVLCTNVPVAIQYSLKANDWQTLEHVLTFVRNNCDDDERHTIDASLQDVQESLSKRQLGEFEQEIFEKVEQMLQDKKNNRKK